MPHAVMGPILRMFFCERRFKCMDLVGEPRLPAHGLVPGCPSATFVMSILTKSWLEKCRALGVVARAWVDDCTAFATGLERGCALGGAIKDGLQELEQTFALKVNKKKSGTICACECAGSAIAAATPGCPRTPPRGAVSMHL